MTRWVNGKKLIISKCLSGLIFIIKTSIWNPKLWGNHTLCSTNSSLLVSRFTSSFTIGTFYICAIRFHQGGVHPSIILNLLEGTFDLNIVVERIKADDSHHPRYSWNIFTRIGWVQFLITEMLTTLNLTKLSQDYKIIFIQIAWIPFLIPDTLTKLNLTQLNQDCKIIFSLIPFLIPEMLIKFNFTQLNQY